MSLTVSNKDKVFKRRAGERYDGDLKRSLMDAAIRAHSISGFEKLSLRAVARSINVSHAAPAHYFGDKAGLLTAIATEGFEKMATKLVKAANLKGEPLAVMRSVAQAYAEFAAENPAHYDAMFRLELHREDDRFDGAGGGAYDIIEMMVRSFQDEGWLPDTDTTALTTASWALMHGLSTLSAGGSLERKHPGALPSDLVEIALSVLLPNLKQPT